MNVARLIWRLCLVAVGCPLLCIRAADTKPPLIVQVGSLNGEGVGICFSEPVDPVAATNAANYTVWNVNPTNASTSKTNLVVTGVTLRPDGQSVQLSLSELLSLRLILVWATNIQDLAGNVITNAYYPGPIGFWGGDLVHLLAADLPQPGVNPLERGSVYTCWTIAGVYEVTAGGSGLESTNDGFHFLFQEITGDFDVKVKVTRLDPVSRWSKAPG